MTPARWMNNGVAVPLPLTAMNRTTAFLLMLTLSFCGSLHAAAKAPWVEVGGKRFSVELAIDDASRAQGLMHRQKLPAGQGMLFIHDYTDYQGYWMKNTLLPLDILYFDEQRRLVTQQRDAQPCRSTGNDCPVYPSFAPARYVLELIAGSARAMGLKDGDVLTLGPGIPPLPRPRD